MHHFKHLVGALSAAACFWPKKTPEPQHLCSSGVLFSFLLFGAVGQHKGQLSSGGTFAVHIGGRLADAHRAPLFHQLTVEGEHIPRRDLFAEACILDAAKEASLPAFPAG